jgi:hypothetical protein
LMTRIYKDGQDGQIRGRAAGLCWIVDGHPLVVAFVVHLLFLRNACTRSRAEQTTRAQNAAKNAAEAGVDREEETTVSAN